jgi:uncharacterized protein
MSIQNWDLVSFLHWRTDPTVIRSLLPPGVDVDTFDGAAWLGLVPFRIWMRLGPVSVPGSRFPETNVRTYVTGPDGKRGLWFLSLDVGRAVVAAAARLAVGLPYRWSRMRIEHRRDSVRYDARRIVPPGARSTVEVIGGSGLAEENELTDFLTARFCLYASAPLGLVRVDVEHPPWVLHQASATIVDDGLVTATRASVEPAEPLVHFSRGVRVRVRAPVPVRG